MSDRVAFIGGSEAGRDHFAYPVSTVAVGVGTPYPLDIDLVTMMRWFWRVKRWQVDFGVEATHTSGGVDTDASCSGSFDFGFKFAGYDSGSALVYYANYADSRESDVVLKTGAFFTAGTGNAQADYDGEPDDPTAASFPFDIKNFTITNSGVSKSFSFALPFADPIWNSGLLYAPMRLRVESRDFSGDTEIAPTVFNFGDYNVDGFSNTVWGANAQPPHTDGFTFCTAAAANVSVKEYWPYAAKDGTPIYNTSTGAQLQSPFN